MKICNKMLGLLYVIQDEGLVLIAGSILISCSAKYPIYFHRCSIALL